MNLRAGRIGEPQVRSQNLQCIGNSLTRSHFLKRRGAKSPVEATQIGQTIIQPCLLAFQLMNTGHCRWCQLPDQWARESIPGRNNPFKRSISKRFFDDGLTTKPLD
ncbi:hypothetical protein SAMN04490182_5834 [Pseudomonas cedrina]|uniref:Transposase n=1 Tax=Pseudomonas cedrina TaxID=651740 RepID=A0ABY0V391_PSECE|nr:hypothetical protein SAMN04490182_5834 [Pseudomonas cedrina]